MREDGSGVVKILLLEDSPIDADLIREYLRRGGVAFDIERVVTRDEFDSALQRGGHDLILSDYSLPAFDGLAALAIARQVAPDLPFIFVSGMLGEEIAIESLKNGATDYVVKTRLGRLPMVVSRALAEAREREARRRVEQRTRLLVAELSHRVKNTLMMVLAIAQQTLRRSNDLAEFEGAFLGRLQALSAAHSLLLRSNWEDMDLRELVEETLRPFRRGDSAAFLLDGPSVSVPPQLALTTTLVLHELATNAAKYGALTRDGGTVSLAWSVGPYEGMDGDSRSLTLDWEEANGPPVTAPERSGFGTTLIQRSVAFELNGAAQLSFEETGVRCRLSFPLGT
jgi:two-component sensor histidine kinase